MYIIRITDGNSLSKEKMEALYPTFGAWIETDKIDRKDLLMYPRDKRGSMIWANGNVKRVRKFTGKVCKVEEVQDDKEEK